MNWNDYYMEQAGVGLIIIPTGVHCTKEGMVWEVCLIDS